jgi:hypothetical protein
MSRRPENASPEPPTERAVVAGGNARDPRKSTGVLAVEKVDAAREDVVELASKQIDSGNQARQDLVGLARHAIDQCVKAAVALALCAVAGLAILWGAGFNASWLGLEFGVDAPAPAPAAAAFDPHAMNPDTDTPLEVP